MSDLVSKIESLVKFGVCVCACGVWCVCAYMCVVICLFSF